MGSAAIGSATTALYLVAIVAEGNNAFWDVFPWALLMLVGVGIAVSAAIVGDPRMGRNIAIAAAVLFAIIGAVSIFSVGMGLIVAAVLAALAASEPVRAPTS